MTNTTDHDAATARPVLEHLHEERIFYINPQEDSSYEITEACDDYFSVTLSKEDMQALGSEIIAMARYPRYDRLTADNAELIACLRDAVVVMRAYAEFSEVYDEARDLLARLDDAAAGKDL